MASGLLSRLFGGASGPSTSAVGYLPKGLRIYAIGDIHGRDDLLENLLGMIEADAQAYAGALKLVFIGDYIDRGPASKAVIDRLLTGIPDRFEPVFLRGNHEQALLDFVKDPEAAAAWISWGGDAALESYGVPLRENSGRLRGPHLLGTELGETLHETGHDVFYQSTKLWHVEGGFLFVHAGVRPNLALEYQISNDFMMIRDDFLKRPHGLPYRIVFGHTIMEQPLVLEDRIGIDTGAYATGTLTAVCLEQSDAGETVTRLLQT